MYLAIHFYKIFLFLLICKINSIFASGNYYYSNKGNQFYIDATQQYSWTESLIECMDRNMTLVTINTEQKSNEINQLVKNIFFTNKNLWVGGIMSRYPQKRYIWLTTGKTFTYTNWDSNNPNFYESKQHCIQIGLNNQMQWNDMSCYVKIGFICESDEKHLKYENLKQEMNKIIKEKETREKLLQQELENVKMEMKQSETKHLENIQKLKQDLENSQNKLKHLEETKKISENEQDTEKREQLLQQELEFFMIRLKQKAEKYFQCEENLQKDSQNIENNIDVLENKDNLVHQMDHFKNIKNPYFIFIHFHQDRYEANEIRQN